MQETPLERKNRIKAAKEIEAAKALEETTAACTYILIAKFMYCI